MNATQIKPRLLFMAQEMTEEAQRFPRGPKRDQLLRVSGEVARRAADGSIPACRVKGVLEGCAILIAQRAAERIPEVIPWG